MLAMGTMRAARDGGAGGRLRYQEIYSFTTGEAGNMPRRSLQAFLPLRARVLERFPAAAPLSYMQLLLFHLRDAAHALASRRRLYPWYGRRAVRPRRAHAWPPTGV